MKRLLYPLAVALLALSGLASANVNPDWIQADFNGNGEKDLIATSNLADIVFNPKGEVIFWHPKVTAGQAFISQKDGVYNFSNLKNQPSLVRKTVTDKSGSVTQQGGKALEVVIPGNSAAPQVQPVQFSKDIPNNELKATFRYSQGAANVTKTVTVHPRNFIVDVDVNVQGAPSYTLNVNGLGGNKDPQTKILGQSGEVQPTGAVQNIRYAAIQDPIKLFSLTNQSATALVLRPDPKNPEPLSASVTGGPQSNIALKLSGEARFQLYGGKNELIHFYQGGFTELPGLFQANIFGDLSLLVVKLLFFLHKYLLSWALAIAVFTLLVRGALWPIMQSQGRMTAKMQFLQPELKAIQAKYKDNPQQLQAETMRLYREHQVNPAGCLSTFATLPVLAVMWSTIRNVEFDSGFLWLPDLAIPDPFYILALLYVAANLLNLYVMTRKTPEMFRQQMFIYLIFAYFALTFPAGVTMYWILSTLIGTVQQLLINRQMVAVTAAAAAKGRVTVEPAPPPKAAPRKLKE